MRMPKGRSIQRTSRSVASVTGPNSATVQATGRAMNSETRSGVLMATVFGSTSAKTITSTDMTTVA